MDPLETVIFEKDTTLMIMLGAARRGHEVFYLPEEGISLREGKLFFHSTRVTPQPIPQKPFILKETLTLSQNDIHAVFIRLDPPFDQRYLENTWLLDHLPKRIPAINSPLGLRSVNEKIWAAQFKNIVPPTLIGAAQDDLLEFINQQNDVIAKPTDAFGGKGVFHITKGDTNTPVILETLTQHYKRPIVLQKYLAPSAEGDKRILLLNGEILGSLMRVHSNNSHRNNLFAGGKPQAATISSRDKEIVSVLKPYLQKLGLYFVGIDIIGDYLIEVNVTSPTCLQEMNRLYNVALENNIIDFVEQWLIRRPSQAPRT